MCGPDSPTTLHGQLVKVALPRVIGGSPIEAQRKLSVLGQIVAPGPSASCFDPVVLNTYDAVEVEIRRLVRAVREARAHERDAGASYQQIGERMAKRRNGLRRVVPSHAVGQTREQGVSLTERIGHTRRHQPRLLGHAVPCHGEIAFPERVLAQERQEEADQHNQRRQGEQDSQRGREPQPNARR